MSDNKDNEVTTSKSIAARIHIEGGNINVEGYESEIPKANNSSVEYLRYLADECFERGEYENAVPLYRQAMETTKNDNLTLLSFLQASLANTYAKLHDFDQATHYYQVARYSLVQQLKRNIGDPPTQNSVSLTRSSILAFILGMFLFLAPIVYFNYVGFIKGDTSALPGLMLPLVVSAIIGYGLVYAKTTPDRARLRNRRRS